MMKITEDMMMLMITMKVMMMMRRMDDDDDIHGQGQTTPGKDVGFEEEMEELHLSRLMLSYVC